MLEGPEKWSYLHWGRGVQTQPSILEETHGQHLKKDLGRLVSWYGPVLETDFPNEAESVYKRIKTAGRGAEAKFQNGQPGSEMMATQNPANSCCLLCTYYVPGRSCVRRSIGLVSLIHLTVAVAQTGQGNRRIRG